MFKKPIAPDPIVVAPPVTETPMRFELHDSAGHRLALVIITDEAIEILPMGGGFVSSAEPFADGKLLRLTFVAAARGQESLHHVRP